MARWFEGGNFGAGAVPLLALVTLCCCGRGYARRPRCGAFVLTLCFFALGFAGLVLGILPNIVPPGLSIWDAAFAAVIQGFVWWGW